MRRLFVLLAAALALSATLARAPSAWACTCIAGASLEKQFKQADVVFAGRVAALATPNPSDDVVAEVAVTGVYKGTVPASAAVRTARDVESCGIAFVAGTRYAVFARVDHGVYRADLCEGTTSDIGLLERAGFHPGSPSSPVAAPAATTTDSDGRTGALIGSAVLIALVAGGYWRMRRARAGRHRAARG